MRAWKQRGEKQKRDRQRGKKHNERLEDRDRRDTESEEERHRRERDLAEKDRIRERDREGRMTGIKGEKQSGDSNGLCCLDKVCCL